MSPERVSVGEEGEGHFTYRDRRQKRAQGSTFGLADGFTTFVCGIYWLALPNTQLWLWFVDAVL